MKAALFDGVIAVLLAAVAVGLIWIGYEAVVTIQAERLSPRLTLESMAFLPVAIVVFLAVASMFCGLPVATTLIIYALLAQSRPSLRRARIWVPVSIGLGLLVGSLAQAMFGDFWSSDRAGVNPSEGMSSVILGATLSFTAFAVYVYRSSTRR